MKPPHLAINDEVSKEAVSQLRIFSMQKFRNSCSCLSVSNLTIVLKEGLVMLNIIF
ncbi:MAG TPA: hypothetical protein VJH68_03715 [Candidatus Nanoarchaeia archaeon]|nr:hypothetical protein [Candidatus Nanoarchaeia archaeon]